MKFQLSIATNYCSSWGAVEGVREIIQNAMDAHDDGHEMKIQHSGSTLKVSSEGVRLDPKVWLMGMSSKSSGNYRGQFGEGLALGTLALVRAGMPVKFISGDESWTPKLETSEVFGEEVLTIYTHKRQNESTAFVVEIGDVSKESWESLKPRFLHLTPPKDVVDTYHAKVILDPDFKGKVFIKGIYVQFSPDLSAGYDFKTLQTDRDRKMVSSYDLKYYAAKAWEEAMTKTGCADRVAEMLESGAADVQDLPSAMGFNSPVAQVLTGVFRKKHGEDAIPVTSMGEAREVEHFGKKGVVVPIAMATLLRKEDQMNLGKAREAYATAAKKTYSYSDLSDEEKATYNKVLELVEPAAAEMGFAPVENRLTIVDFGAENIDGKANGGRISVAKRLLTDFRELLCTVVHEVAHAHGVDGDVGHERAVERLFAAIVARQVFAN